MVSLIYVPCILRINPFCQGITLRISEILQLEGVWCADLLRAVDTAHGHPLLLRAERVLFYTNVLLLETLQTHLQGRHAHKHT